MGNRLYSLALPRCPMCPGSAKKFTRKCRAWLGKILSATRHSHNQGRTLNRQAAHPPFHLPTASHRAGETHAFHSMTCPNPMHLDGATGSRSDGGRNIVCSVAMRRAFEGGQRARQERTRCKIGLMDRQELKFRMFKRRGFHPSYACLMVTIGTTCTAGPAGIAMPTLGAYA